MSAKSLSGSLAEKTYRFSPHLANVMRYAFGLTSATVLVVLSDFPLAFLIPVLLASFLQPPAQELSWKQGLSFVLVIALASSVSLAFNLVFLEFPVVYAILSALILFLLFYSQAGGASPLVLTWSLIAFTLMPVLALNSQNLAVSLAHILVLAALIAVIYSKFLFLIFPHRQSSQGKARARGLKGREQVRSALLSSVVIWPLLMAFIIFNWMSAILGLVLAAVLASNPNVTAVSKGGAALLMGNALGGFVAILLYGLLSMAPSYVFFVFSLFFIALYFAFKGFSSHKLAPLYIMAMSTTVLIIGNVVTSDGEAGELVLIRVLTILAAAIYTVVAFKLIARWNGVTDKVLS